VATISLNRPERHSAVDDDLREELARAWDEVLADAMAFPEIHYGLMSDSGGAPLATMLAGPSRAKWMLMTGRPVDADHALAWGLVDEVVAPEELDEAA
jgi:enoyl-CoA hydratase/carnithine racemase